MLHGITQKMKMALVQSSVFGKEIVESYIISSLTSRLSDYEPLYYNSNPSGIIYYDPSITHLVNKQRCLEKITGKVKHEQNMGASLPRHPACSRLTHQTHSHPQSNYHRGNQTVPSAVDWLNSGLLY